MIIPNMLMESKYVSIEVLEEIKKFCDGKSQITESRSPKNNQDKMTYLSYGGLKSYEWVITSLL